ncbi:MAG: hypothetical protein M0P59_06690 [Gallionella sp.]|jgi:hypothetical protein|nr:hypothetical protein [Gallionella sp.]
MSPKPTDSSDLPVLTQVVGAPAPEDLPTLTEVVAPPPPAAHSLSEEEIQQLLRLLESRLEVVFTQKLSLHLERLQRLAVKQAVNEFRAALPELLHEILNTPPQSRP